MSQISTLRPGLLVSLKTSMRGNVTYRTQDIQADHLTDDGERLAVWQTERTVADPTEHEIAVKARGRASSAIRGVCAKSAFGLLCPESKADQLELAMSDARMIVDQFNRQSKLTRIDVFVIIGRVAQDDAEAIRAINSEVRDLLAAIEEGVKNCDVKVIRENASKARNLAQMLTPVANSALEEAITEARRVARRIVEVGETAALEIDRDAIRALTEARTAFLDLDAPAVILGDSTVATPPELDLPEPPRPDAIETDSMSEAEFETFAADKPEPAAIEFDFDPPAFMQREWNKPKPVELDQD